MGSNSEIKNFDFQPYDDAPTLFPTRKSKFAVAAKLLTSPWVKRASSLETAGPPAAGGRDAIGGKVYEQPIQVAWDTKTRRPTAFIWKNHVYNVDSVVSSWILEKGWWDPGCEVRRYFVRVISGGGTYDLFFDKRAGGWFVDGVAD